MAHHEHPAAWAGVAATQEKGETDSAEATLEGQPLRTSKTKRRHGLQMWEGLQARAGSKQRKPHPDTFWKNPLETKGKPCRTGG